MKTSEIKTERLILRPIREEELESVFSALQKYSEVTRFLSWRCPENFEKFQKNFHTLSQRMQEGKLVRMGIFINGQFCGVVGLDQIVQMELARRLDLAHLYFWILPPFQHKGIAAEAVSVLLEFGFEKLDLHKIISGHISENEGSGKVLSKVGFRLVGERKEYAFFDGKWWGYKMYELLKKF